MQQTTNSVSRVHLQRWLLLGLSISAALLLSAMLVAFRTVHQINLNTTLFAQRQVLAKNAIDEIERKQADLNARWMRLAHRKDVVSRQELLAQLADSHEQMATALESAYEQTEFLRETIYQAGHGLLQWTVWLFCLCVVLSLACASWAVRASTTLFRRLEQQASELTQMQYQILESQEDVARRFSHELHDELGQALTAVKANLSALRAAPADDHRVEDCLALVDGAIKNVRELSQLLRPTILDDFGLDAALRSLSDNFSIRTGIKVEYQSDLDGERLRDETETHLFRIAQEALTNIARHAHAQNVCLKLQKRKAELTMNIRDDGQGLPNEQRSPGLGLVGMRTRARGCGGELKVVSEPGKGVEIEVACPIKG